MTQDPFEPRGAAVVNARAAKRVERGHLWVWASDVTRRPGRVAGLVAVEDPRGRALGWALASPRSEIALRMLSEPGPAPDLSWLVERLAAAWQRREHLMGSVDAWRWVHGEADLLPGIFIDRYDDCVAIQTACEGAEVLEPALVDAVVGRRSPRLVVLRDDSSMRAAEGLRRHVTVVHGDGPSTVRYREGDVTFEVDLVRDQKTGGFLDQSYNHLLAGRLAHGEALDGCTYHGGFALQLAGKCASVLACDVSRPALERASENAARNGIDGVRFVEESIFDLLPRLAGDGRRFDTIVLDPPAFASGKQTEKKAARAYREINRRALEILNPNGLLITCSCSGRIRPDRFDEIIARAAADAGRRLHRVAALGAAPDHPSLVGMPETDYLKCRVMMVI